MARSSWDRSSKITLYSLQQAVVGVVATATVLRCVMGSGLGSWTRVKSHDSAFQPLALREKIPTCYDHGYDLFQFLNPDVL